MEGKQRGLKEQFPQLLIIQEGLKIMKSDYLHLSELDNLVDLV